MGTVDRIIFGIIALALMLLALQPHAVRADKYQDINIAAVGGHRIFGAALPTK